MKINKYKYILLPFIWKLFPSKRVSTIYNFHLIEDDSHWQILQYINNTVPNEERVFFCTQAIEERGHALIFKSLYQETTKSHLPVSYPKRSMILDKDDGYEQFANLCEIGETSALNKFINLHKVLQPGHFKSSLHTIIKDEINHSNQFKGRDIQNNVKWKWFKNNFLSLGTRASTVIISIILFFVYFLLIVPLSFPISIFNKVHR